MTGQHMGGTERPGGGGGGGGGGGWCKTECFEMGVSGSDH